MHCVVPLLVYIASMELEQFEMQKEDKLAIFRPLTCAYAKILTDSDFFESLSFFFSFTIVSFSAPKGQLGSDVLPRTTFIVRIHQSFFLYSKLSSGKIGQSVLNHKIQCVWVTLLVC